MNTALLDNIRMASVLILAISSCVIWAKEPGSTDWKHSFKEMVVNDVQLPASTNEVLREDIGTNTLQSINSQAFRLRSSSDVNIQDSGVRTPENIKEKIMEYDIEKGVQKQQVRIRIINSLSGRDEALNGLAYLMGTATSMGGKPFKQLPGGPGDVCFVFKTETSGARGPHILFFCRDNVAIQLTQLSAETDLLAVARLIDSSIMASPVKQK